METQNLFQAFASSKIELNAGATLVQIEAAEEVLNFRFPEQFKAFYLLCDGFRNNDWTEGMFSLWTLDMMTSDYWSYELGFIPFCDYLINSHGIGFLKGKSGIYKSYDLDKPICLTFNEALKMILDDAEEVN